MKVFLLLKLIFSPKIIFLIRYPTSKCLNDGYFQRVEKIDKLFSDKIRIYINATAPHGEPFIKIIKDNCIQLNINNNLRKSYCILLALFRSTIYAHSILTLNSKLAKSIFKIGKNKIFDVHGVVPEEFAYHGDLNGQQVFNDIELFAVKKANVIIGVTQAMINHIKSKYNITKTNKTFLVIPILQEQTNQPALKVQVKPLTVIYAGGTHKWQKIEEMLKFVSLNSNNYNFIFLVPTPDDIEKQYKDLTNGKSFPGTLKSVAPEDVSKYYELAQFGFVLRDNVIVNQVACPTKLVEYLLNNVVPIVDTPNIGDFETLGYEYVKLTDNLDLSQIDIEKICRKNQDVVLKIRQTYSNSVKQLQSKLN